MDGMDELLTTEEVAGIARVSTQTVNRWAKAGILPVVRPSLRVVRFRRADVEALLTPRSAGLDNVGYVRTGTS